MKKIAISLLIVLCSISIFAKELPNGVNVPVTKIQEENGVIVSATIAADVDVPTSIGTISARANSEICFYPNGAVKSVYTKGNYVAATACGNFVVSSYSAMNSTVSISFYENGNLKEAYLPYVTLKNYPEKTNVVECALGNVYVKSERLISFHENGTVKSFSLQNDFKIDENHTLPAYSKIYFHENGRIAECTFKEGIRVGNSKSKAKSVVKYSPEGIVTYFFPEENSYIEIGDFAYFYKKNESVEFYDNGNFKYFVIDVANKDLTLMGYKVCEGSEHEVFNTDDSGSMSNQTKPATLNLACEFYESGTLKCMYILTNRSSSSVFVYSEDPTFVFQYGSQYVRTKRVEFYENGAIKSLNFSPAFLSKGDASNKVLYVGKIVFSPDQSVVGRICNEITYGKSSFYDEQNMCIILSNDQPKIIDSKLSFLSDVTWDENNKVIGYTVNVSDKIVQREVK